MVFIEFVDDFSKSVATEPACLFARTEQSTSGFVMSTDFVVVFLVSTRVASMNCNASTLSV